MKRLGIGGKKDEEYGDVANTGMYSFPIIVPRRMIAPSFLEDDPSAPLRATTILLLYVIWS